MLALTVVLQIVAPYIAKFGFVEIALGLIPMILGACIYGPVAGLFLGAALGVTVILSPATLTYFVPVNPIATVILCLVKTGLAGFATGWIYRLLSKKNTKQIVTVSIASAVAPCINTSLFIGGTLLFFMEVYGGDVTALLTWTLLVNFLIELVVVALLVVGFERILKVYGKKFLPEE